MKSDSEIRTEVLAELDWDPVTKGAAVGVAVQAGVVTLSGHLSSHAQKYAVEHAARRVRGVRALAVELEVRLPADWRRSDTEIALAVERALEWNALVPHEKISVQVEAGCVTLEGEVEWHYQREVAEACVRDLLGVTSVANQLVVRAKATPLEVQSKIEGALKRQAEREASRIEVHVAGAEVILRGQVHSWAERRAAEGAAWSAPGVTHVSNHLSVQ